MEKLTLSTNSQLNRFCVITQQRTGSTYCCQLLCDFIKENYSWFNLNELFEPNDSRKTIFKYDNELDSIRFDDFNDITYESAYKSNLVNLKNVDTSIGICLKLFWYPAYEKKIIIDSLIDLNFKFIWLIRKNVKEQFLSFLLASSQQAWMYKDYDTIYLSLDIVESEFKQFQYTFQNTNKFMQEIYPKISNLTYSVSYENMNLDLNSILEKNISFNFDSKQAKKNHYDYFKNKSEIQEFVDDMFLKHDFTHFNLNEKIL